MAEILFENEKVVAFKEKNPIAPVHFIVAPKNPNGLIRVSNATSAHTKLLGDLMFAASQVAKQQGLADGYRIIMNDGMNGG